MPRRLLIALVAGLVALAGCRVDVVVELQLAADGTGQLVVTATADADVVARAPGLADDLRFGDAKRAGWTVDGPSATDDGGLTVVLHHAVTSAEDATNLLGSLGPPFEDVALERTTVGDETTVRLTGRLRLGDGFDSFTDADLLEAVGGTPFAADLARSDAAPERSMSFVLRADLPGELEATTAARDDGVLEWEAPLDGTALELATTTVQRPASGGSWAGPVASLALVLLAAWLVVAATAVVLLIRARRSRARRVALDRLR